MNPSIVIQRPAARALQLVLLFHGVGGSPEDLVPLGEALARAFPDALVASMRSPHAAEGGRGWQWFPVAGITEENRPGRVAQAMPGFLAEIRRWQDEAGLGPEATAIVGFSQGGIMALEATKASPPPAQRVAALGARFAELPDAAAHHVTVHMIHGKEDRVMPYGLAVAAAERLIALGTDVTLDVLPFVGHGVPEEAISVLVERLQRYLPQWRWREATQADPGAASTA